MYDYQTDHLEDDEIIYELELRGQAIIDNTPFSWLKRDLRHWLKHDRVNNPQYKTHLKIEDEFPLISPKIAELKDSVLKRPTSKARSRLIHLKNRILRTNAPDDNASRIKLKMLTEVEMLLSQYFGIDSVSDTSSTRSEKLDQSTVDTTPRTSENLAPSNIVIREGNFFVIDPSRVNFNANNFANIPPLGFPIQENLFNTERGPYRLPVSSN